MLRYMHDIAIHMRFDEENVYPANAPRSRKLKARVLGSLTALSCQPAHPASYHVSQQRTVVGTYVMILEVRDDKVMQ